MKKNRLILPLLLAALAAACAESYVSTPVPFLEKRVVDFSRYQNVYFVDFLANVPDIALDVDAENRKVFSEELPFAINQKITTLDPPHWAMVRHLLRRYCPAIDFQYANSVFFAHVFRSHPQSLFITGKLNLEIKKLGVVKRVKDEEGNTKNTYAAVQLWEMAMKIAVIDGDSGQTLLQETYTEKMEPSEATTAQFNFNSMVGKITARLGLALQPRKATQERYILFK
ncbi:MAG: hypothetical protein NTW95_07750 [Candidatus Aminicenantes bacterium]|nr:hypothetical protein [Candidatus Aminicenantes bacterium]